MTRKILLSLSLLSAGICFAAPLTPAEALSRLENNKISTRSGIEIKPAMTVKTEINEPALYIFDNNDQKGFMVLSADDMVTPVLGYSDSSTFDPNNVPPALQYWLNEYARQVQFVRENENNIVKTRAGIQLPAWNAIAPKVKTQWDQDAPYYNLCPLDGTSLSYTGCVATSMAQVLKYFEYPAKGQGQITYNCRTLGKQLAMNFEETVFDWNNMLDSYNGNYTEQQATAVATLMKACGYSVQMSYSSVESGAVSPNIAPALVNYFDYDKGISYQTRDLFTYSEWAKMLYDNISTIGPVIYDGSGAMGGHSFVFDGYDGDGHFHVNWGWGGMSDGYFLIDALDPSGIGIGGGSGGFNYDQGAVFGIQPNKGGSAQQNEIFLFGSLTGVISGSSLSLEAIGSDTPGWGYHGLGNMRVRIGIAYVPADTPNATPKYQAQQQTQFTNVSPAIYIQASDGNIKINLNQVDMTDGVKYKVSSVYYEEGKENVWNDVKTAVGYYNYFYLTKNGSRWTVENVAPMEYSANNISLESPLYYGNAVKAKATITNPNNTELTKSFCLALLNGRNVAFLGNSVVLSLAPNESQVLEWASTLTKQTGQSAVTKPTDFTLALYDDQTGTVFYTSDVTVTMERSQGTASVKSSIVVENAQLDGRIYQLENSSDFNVNSTLNVTQGYFTDKIYLTVFSQIPGTLYLGVYSQYPLGDFIFLESPGEASWVTNIKMPDAVIGDTYYLALMNDTKILGSSSGNSPDVGFKVLSHEAGVEELIADNEILFYYDRASKSLNVLGGYNGIATVEAYYLNGMKVPANVSDNNGAAFVDLSESGKGMIIVTAIDKQGNRKSTKLAL